MEKRDTEREAKEKTQKRGKRREKERMKRGETEKSETREEEREEHERNMGKFPSEGYHLQVHANTNRSTKLKKHDFFK